MVGVVASGLGGFHVGKLINEEDHGSAEPADPRRFDVPLRGDEPQIGPDDALVTIIEFGDYNCSYCRIALEPLDEVLDEFGPDVRLIYKHLPRRNHAQAREAAHAAWAAHQQSRFWPMHRAFFESEAELDHIESAASELDLDIERFRHDMASPDSVAQLDDDVAAAEAVGVVGTPHFFVNGHGFAGAMSPARWHAIIERELQSANRLIASGVAPSAVYERLVK